MPRYLAAIVTLSSTFTLAHSLLARPTTAPATQEVDAEKKKERVALEGELLGMPWKHVDSLTEVFQFQVTDGRLSVKPILRNTGSDVRLFVPHMRGALIYHTNTINLPSGKIEALAFRQIDLTPPGSAEVMTTISDSNGQVVIARDEQLTDEATASVQVIQDGPNATNDIAASPVRVFIRRDTPGQPPVDLKFEGRSITQLCIDHRAELSKYVRPIFRELHQEASIFTPDARSAWQVFAAEATIEPADAARINKLAGQLDADDFQQRNDALTKLQEMGEPAALLLMRVDRLKLSEERRSSVDTVLAPFLPLDPATAESLGKDKLFLLDCLGSDDEKIRAIAWRHLQELTKTTVAFNPAADEPTREAAVGTLRDSLGEQ